MKHTLFILVILLCCSFSMGEQPQASGVKVYICTGPQSKRYHKTPDCQGLRSCSKEIKEVTIEYAKKLGRTPCGYCYR